MVTDQELQDFVAGCQVKVDSYFQNLYGCQPKTVRPPKHKLVYKKGRKYAKISVENRYVFAFIEMATGDVLKPASYKVPAKHPRGNLYDEHKGLGRVGPHGPESLR